jgi:hypothetical protein
LRAGSDRAAVSANQWLFRVIGHGLVRQVSAGGAAMSSDESDEQMDDQQEKDDDQVDARNGECGHEAAFRRNIRAEQVIHVHHPLTKLLPVRSKFNQIGGSSLSGQTSGPIEFAVLRAGLDGTKPKKSDTVQAFVLSRHTVHPFKKFLLWGDLGSLRSSVLV